MTRTVEMRLEVGTLLADHAPRREAEDLKAAAVGQDRRVPADEAMQAATPCDQLVAGTEKEVVGVAEDDLRAGVVKVAMKRRLYGPLCPDRHERGRLHDAVRRMEFSASRGAVGAVKNEAKGTHGRTYY